MHYFGSTDPSKSLDKLVFLVYCYKPLVVTFMKVLLLNLLLHFSIIATF